MYDLVYQEVMELLPSSCSSLIPALAFRSLSLAILLLLYSSLALALALKLLLRRRLLKETFYESIDLQDIVLFAGDPFLDAVQ